MADLIPEEIPQAQQIAYQKSLVRGNGQNPPPYNPEATVGDFWQAAGEVIARRSQAAVGNKSVTTNQKARQMKIDWIDRIAAEMRQVWMEWRDQNLGAEKGRNHKHYIAWKNLPSVEDGTEAMDQDRFVASLILLAFAQGRLSKSADLCPLIHNSVQLWIRLTGEKLERHHVAYLTSDDPSINKWMMGERAMQAERVWPILQGIENITEVRSFDWVGRL